MKLFFSILFIGCLFYLSAQKVEGGFHAGLNFPQQPEIESESSITDVKAALKDQNTAYHVGMYLKANLVSIYLRSELNYSRYKAEYIDNLGSEFSMENHRLDVPFLVGFQPIKSVFIHGGLVGSYYFGDDHTVEDFQQIENDKIQIGFQIGTGLQLNKLSLEGRYEAAFSSRTIELANVNTEYTFSSNPSQFIISIGYQL